MLLNKISQLFGITCTIQFGYKERKYNIVCKIQVNCFLLCEKIQVIFAFAYKNKSKRSNFTPNKHQFVADRGRFPLFIPCDFCFFGCFQNKKQIFILVKFRRIGRLQRFRMRELGVHLDLCRPDLDAFINPCGSHSFRHLCIFCQVRFRI